MNPENVTSIDQICAPQFGIYGGCSPERTYAAQVQWMVFGALNLVAAVVYVVALFPRVCLLKEKRCTTFFVSVTLNMICSCGTLPPIAFLVLLSTFLDQLSFSPKRCKLPRRMFSFCGDGGQHRAACAG
jgi:hypothetical protein